MRVEADIDEHVGHALGQALGVSQVDALVGGVSVGLWSQKTQGNDESVRVETTELGEERNRTSHAVGAVVFSIIEVLGGVVHHFVEPWLWVLHAPTITIVVTVDLNLAVVWHISSQFLSNNLGCLVCVHVWWKAHGKTE